MRISSFEFRVLGFALKTMGRYATSLLASYSQLATRNSQLSTGALVLAAMLTAWPLSGDAQVLNDPTRPPASVLSATPGVDAPSTGPVLQSVMISPTGRSAIIGGERVKQGGKYGDARVIRITENEVVLRSASGTETLRMYPEVTMKPVVPAPPISKKPVRKKRGPATNTRGKQG